MRLTAIDPPWAATLTPGQHQLVLYVLGVAALAFFAGFLRAWLTRTEVGTRYRTAVTARLGMIGVAVVTHVVLVVVFLGAYELTPAGWVPTGGAIDLFAARYAGWTVSVPLLTVELLAVCTISGMRARRSRTIALSAAVAMIVSGFLGAIVVGDGTSATALLVFAGLGSVFGVIVAVVLVRAVRRSRFLLTPEAQALLNRATIALLGGWVLYPLVYLLPLLGGSAALTTTMIIVLTLSDVTIKLLFAGRIHRVAKLRTAEDVRAGIDVHPESIWISSVKQSDAGLAREVFLADGAAVHDRRPRPPSSAAKASPAPEQNEELLL